MKILIHDYPGHAFPVQLARELARRGHEVLHVWSARFQSPKGALARRADDSANLRLLPLDLGGTVAKYDFVRRVLQERRYGAALAKLVARERPDVVLANGPLDVLAPLRHAAHAAQAAFVFWLQDFYGIAIDAVVRKKLPGVGIVIGAWYRALERRLLAGADGVITISEDFRPMLARMGVADAKVGIIENWAPRDEIPPRPRDNEFARAHGLTGLTFLYSGTLGLKHDPKLLLTLARHLDARGAMLVVVSEGLGADWLKAQAMPGLILPFQPHESFPDVLGAADVLVAILERDAGVYSVPSKILAYLCAGRPMLCAFPLENRAARLVSESGAGRVVAPDDAAGWLAAADALAGDAVSRGAMAAKALDTAARIFDIAAIAARFDALLAQARS